jgi:DNA-binding CsgD family transcriptional regulator
MLMTKAPGGYETGPMCDASKVVGRRRWAGVRADAGTQLLERESSLASLVEYAGQARHGDGRLVLIAGEAGVGKSALVEQLRRDLPDARWWWGACDGLFTPRPLGPLFDLADQLGGDLAELCRAGAEREELFRALLRQISSPATLDVVAIEDVHWADDATLDLLRFLGRRLREAAVLLITTYRDDALAADHPLRVALGDLASQRYTRRIDLAPLSPQAVGLLAADSGLAPTQLYQLTAGNPFYLIEVLQAGTTEVPASARDAVLARAARLSADAREVLDMAALIGTRVEVPVLAAATKAAATSSAATSSAAATTGPDTVDELVASGLLSGDGAALRFRHEIARLAVAQAVAPHRGPALHQLVLAALRSTGCADDARLAFHAEAASDVEAVLRHAPAAARQAARLASHREAAAQFERALRFAYACEPATLAELYQDYADEVSLLDRWPDAELAGEESLRLWRECGDRLREGAALRRLSRMRWNLCRGQEAAAAIKAAVSTLEPLGPSLELAWAYATFANQRMLSADHDTAIAMAQQAQAMARQLDTTEILSDALNTEAVSWAAKGLDWAAMMRQALDLALAGGHHDRAARAYTNLCGTHVDKREFAEAQAYLAAGIVYCDDHDITTYGTCLRGEQSNLWERTGRWDEAVALSEELLASARSSPANRLCALIRLGTISSRRGGDQVWTYLDEAAGLADQTGEPQQQVPTRLARAEAYWLAGQLDEARREAELADDTCEGLDGWHRGSVAVWLARTGSVRPVRGTIAEPYRLVLDGDGAAAGKLWHALGCPYDAAMALASTSDEATLREALAIFTELGAAPGGRLVRQRLRSLGARAIPVGPRSTTQTDPLGLTRREREVLDLVRAGHTNSAIAMKLVISAKTVDHHVSAILAKLGVPTRAEAAALLNAET